MAKAHSNVSCRQCDGDMSKSKKVDRNYAVEAFGLLLFLLSFAVFFAVPLGWIVGPIMLLASFPMMSAKKRKVWKCGNCGYFFERA